MQGPYPTLRGPAQKRRRVAILYEKLATHSTALVKLIKIHRGFKLLEPPGTT